jgi:thymidylate synthase (FAD)
MKLIKADFEIITPINGEEILKRIEQAGRTCYKSEDKITPNSAQKFVKMLIDKGHESVLEHQSISVKFICDRGVSHEIVRHRLASFSQESTRYCNYSKKSCSVTFVLPNWIEFEHFYKWSENSIDSESPEYAYFTSINYAEKAYLFLLEKGWTPQQARSVLPNSLKTEIVVTANLREWRTIFKQRTSKAAHPQMRELMCPLLSELQSKIPVIFNDIQS